MIVYYSCIHFMFRLLISKLKLIFNFFPVSKNCIGIYLSFRDPLRHWVSYFEWVQFSQPYQDLSFQCPRSITRVSFISLLIYVLFQEKTPFFHYATSSLSLSCLDAPFSQFGSVSLYFCWNVFEKIVWRTNHYVAFVSARLGCDL
jgi:hypothetical protein